MKILFSLILLTVLTGCSSGGGVDPKPNEAGGGPLSGGSGANKAFSQMALRPWCNEYMIQGRQNQDRYTFTEDGLVSYTQYELVNGERKSRLGEATGTWGTDGVHSQVAISNWVFQLSYVIDPALKQESLFLKIDGQWVPFHICDAHVEQRG